MTIFLKKAKFIPIMTSNFGFMNARLAALSTLIGLSAFTSCSNNLHLNKKGVYVELPAKDYYDLLQSGGINIIDVRTKREFCKTHLEGAVNASYLSGHFSKLVSDYHLDTTRTTLIYCETQHRSPLAANRLHKMGFNRIVDLDKGMIHWRRKKYPFLAGTR